jgi:hypothetical protein
VVLQELPQQFAATGVEQVLQVVVRQGGRGRCGEVVHEGLEAGSGGDKGVSCRGRGVRFHRALLPTVLVVGTSEPTKQSPSASGF